MKSAGSWPARDKRSAETIANKLRDLDKGKDTDWWFKKGKAFVEPLAEVLGLDSGGLIDLISRIGSRSHGTDVWTFQVFPALRPLDLRSDRLLPGLPPDLVQRGGPTAPLTWWTAPPGAGKTLVGRWLATQGWEYVSAATWEDAQTKLPERGHAFVELSRPPPALPRRTRGSTNRLCVAASHMLPAEAPATGANLVRLLSTRISDAAEFEEWLPVSSPPADSWSHDLIEWVAANVRPGGGFEVAGVHELFKKLPVSGLFVTPGDMLSFLATIEDIGIKAFVDETSSTTDLLRLVRAWWKATRERSDRGSQRRPNAYVYDRAPDLLVEMTSERLRRGLTAPMSRTAWASLLREQDGAPLDSVKVLRTLEAGDLDAALTMLRRDGEALVSGLEADAVLHDDGEDELAIRPTWIATVVAIVACERLLDEGPRGVGALLLYPELAESTLTALCAEVAKGNTQRVAACVEQQPRSAEELAALDGAVRAIGFALADDIDVPVALVQQAWARQHGTLTARYSGWPELPILSVAGGPASRGATARAAWIVAALAITRKLVDSGHTLASSALSPWSAAANTRTSSADYVAELQAALQNATHCLDHSDAAPTDRLRALPYKIGAALLERFGSLRQGTVLDCQVPDLLVRLAGGEDLGLTDEERREVLRLPQGLGALEAACRRQRATVDDVITWCWTTWGDQYDDDAPPYRERVPLAERERLWRLAPAEVLSLRRLKSLEHTREVWPWLSEPVWTRWLEAWTPRGADPRHAALFEVLPESVALAAVRVGKVDLWGDAAKDVLWKRMPASLLELIDELAASARDAALASQETPLHRLVSSVPDEHGEAMVDRVFRWLADPGAYPGTGAWVNAWLLHHIERRAPGWRRAVEFALQPRAIGSAP